MLGSISQQDTWHPRPDSPLCLRSKHGFLWVPHPLVFCGEELEIVWVRLYLQDWLPSTNDSSQKCWLLSSADNSRGAKIQDLLLQTEIRKQNIVKLSLSLRRFQHYQDHSGNLIHCHQTPFSTGSRQGLMASKNSSYLWLELNRISQTESPWEVFVKYLSLHAGSGAPWSR